MADAPKGTPKLSVELRGRLVRIEIRCADPDTADALYRAAVEGAKAGKVLLDIQTVPRPTIDGRAIEEAARG